MIIRGVHIYISGTCQMLFILIPFNLLKRNHNTLLAAEEQVADFVVLL